jgi:uncharacterized protein (TIGR03083 family)
MPRCDDEAVPAGTRIPADTIDKLEAIWRSISDLGATLDESQWKSPTELPGWTVQDNLSHLIGTESMLQGMPAADAPAEMGEHVKNSMGRFNEAEVEVRRHRAGVEVLAEWNALVNRRLDMLRGADEAYFAKEMATPTGPGTMADFLHIRVLDCWIHEQDMRRAVGAPGHLAGPAAEHTIDRLLRTLPVVIGKRAGTPEGGAVVLELTGGVTRSVICEVTNGRAAVVAAATAEPLATVVLDSETFVILATGRQDAAAMTDRIQMSGEQSLGQRVVDGLNMMI